MLTEHTIDKMNAMKLYAFAEAFSQQLASAEFSELSFEERTGLLVDAEYTARENRKLSRRLSAAKLRYPRIHREHRLQNTPQTRPPAALESCHLRLARRAPQPHHHRAHRHRQIIPRLCLRRARLPAPL